MGCEKRKEEEKEGEKEMRGGKKGKERLGRG